MITEILYEDNHLLVVKKPAMMPVQADASRDLDLLSACKEYIKEKYSKQGAVFLGLVHRLDRPVGGVLVFARTSKSAARLQKSMTAGSWEKSYVAVISGRPPASEKLVDYLYKDKTTGNSRVVEKDHAEAKFAELEFETLQTANSLSLLSIRLKTGRHHQIRVQLASRGWPIWGDARYNPSAVRGQNIALWAKTLSFPHPTRDEIMRFSAPPPKIQPWTEFADLVFSDK